MAISHVTKTFAVADAKIGVLTADPAGGSPTYATLVDVPGIKSVSISGTYSKKSLRGDMTLLDVDATLENVSATINFAKLDLDILAAATGGGVTDSGSGSTEVSTFDLNSADTLKYFKFEAQCTRVDIPAGDLHLVLWKCIPTGLPFAGLGEEDYQTHSLPVDAMPLISTGKWMDVVINETAAAIA